jgi:hypothetical protein
MTNHQQPENDLATHLADRRRRRALRLIGAAAAEIVQKLKHVDPTFFVQPGAAIFPKKIFVTEEGSSQLPDGRSLAYLEAVDQFWDEYKAQEENRSPAEFTAATVRLLQQAVFDARILESRLVERLEPRE